MWIDVSAERLMRLAVKSQPKGTLKLIPLLTCLCGNSESFPKAADESRAGFERAAYAAGWRLSDTAGWTCLRCRKKGVL